VGAFGSPVLVGWDTEGLHEATERLVEFNGAANSLCKLGARLLQSCPAGFPWAATGVVGDPQARWQSQDLANGLEAREGRRCRACGVIGPQPGYPLVAVPWPPGDRIGRTWGVVLVVHLHGAFSAWTGRRAARTLLLDATMIPNPEDHSTA
jgi:hypothetical protein